MVYIKILALSLSRQTVTIQLICYNVHCETVTHVTHLYFLNDLNSFHVCSKVEHVTNFSLIVTKCNNSAELLQH